MLRQRVVLLAAGLCACGKTSPIDYNPQRRAVLEITPAVIPFGERTPGGGVATAEATLRNAGTRDATGIAASITGDARGVFSAGAVPASLGPGGGARIVLTYLPKLPAGSDRAELAITSSASTASARLEAETIDPCDPSRCGPAPDPCHGPGRCAGGVCVHDPLPAVPCDDQDPCTFRDQCDAAGSCRGVPVTCLSPPPATCTGPSTLATWSSPGKCTVGKCVYSDTTITCPFECRNNACFDPCAGAACNAPPNACYRNAGRCVFGRCEYDFNDGARCDDADACTVSDSCFTGVCKGKPMECLTPPGPRCVDPDNSETFDPIGVCQAGSCVYTRRSEACAIACLRGRCVTSCTTALLAGNGVQGLQDGLATFARFSDPYSLAVDVAGTAYVADPGNFRVRQISVGTVSTVSGSAGITQLHDAALDGNGGILIAGAGRIYRVNLGSQVVLAGTGVPGFRDGPASTAQFGNEVSLLGSSGADIFIADADNHRVRRLSASQVTTYAGTGAAALLDGANATAAFHHPHEVANFRGDLYVSDAFNHAVRKVTSTATSTIAGSGVRGFQDGTPASARFDTPLDVAVDPEGAVYVADAGNHCIRRVTTRVTTFAGQCAFSGYVEGPARSARFNVPAGIAVSAIAVFYVSDTGNQRIRRIDCAP